MKIALFVLTLSFLSFSHEAHVQKNSGIESIKRAYAEVYADFLIKDFDRLLDLKLAFRDSSSILNTSAYAKILSSRSYIESRKPLNHKSNRSFNILEVDRAGLYAKVVEEIDNGALRIQPNSRNFNTYKSNNEPVIYPSTSRAGNVTGNTFPKNTWALTFDDGPRGNRTKEIVDNLYARGLKATFFMLTAEAKKYKTSAKYVVDSGMNVALHSYTHPDLNKASSSKVEYEITTAKKDLENLLGVKTSVFRLPYGSGMHTKKLRDTIAKNNYVHIFWNIDTLDWKDKNPQSVLARVKKQMKLTPKHSGVILFHDIQSKTVISSKLTMDYLINEGQKVCTVEDVIALQNGKPNDCK